MDLPEFVEKIVKKISEKEYVYAIYLFGSWAKGKVSKLSDVDICVFTYYTNEHIRNEIYSYGTDFLDVSIFDDLPIWIRFEVFKHGKPLIVKDRKKIEEIKLKTLRHWLDFKHFYEVTLREKFKKFLEYLQVSKRS